MAPEQMAALEALARVATPGPWSVDKKYHAFITGADGKDVAQAESMVQVKDTEQAVLDAAYIAAASPTAILSLIAKAREAEADARRFRWLLDGNHCGMGHSEQGGPNLWRHSVSWDEYSNHTDIRAAIDDAMNGDKP